MIYCVDSSSDEPIMLLNKHIGMDSDEGMGIDGAEFQRELLQLDGLGKKRIQLWINCVGGNVVDGMNIANAILKSNTPVDTYNVGVCASMGGALFMTGRKRIMADYSKLMMHNTSGGDADSVKNFKESCVTLLSSKCKLDEAMISYLMDKETWMGAKECFDHGFCTEVEDTGELNKKWAGSPQAMWKQGNVILNSLIKTKNKMKKVTAKLKLVEDANEDAVLEAITGIENKMNEANAKLKDAQTEVTNLTSQLNEANDKLKKAEEETENAKAAVNEEKAATEVMNFVKIGKIKNDPTVISTWNKLMLNDHEGTKKILEDLPLNKVSNKIETDIVLEADKFAGTAAARMMEISNRIAKGNK